MPSIAADVADALRDAMPAVQSLMADARDVDVFLVALVDPVVDRELRAGDPWGPDEPARRRLLDVLARRCVARVREAITQRLLAASEA